MIDWYLELSDKAQLTIYWVLLLVIGIYLAGNELNTARKSKENCDGLQAKKSPNIK